MAGNNNPTIKNRINAPMPAPGSTLCATGIGVCVGVLVEVGVIVGVAVSGISVTVGVADEVTVGVIVGVFVEVLVGVKVKVGGTGVGVLFCSSSVSFVSSASFFSSVGGQGITLPSALKPQPSCA